ncbi:hypothetical protein AWB71_04339 [Caballeronia peredens]|nr:hypothetical protein AWB71_04339 [Caballeronia peredens]
MHRSFSFPGAPALVACLFLFSAAAAPVHASEPLPDARMLSSAPFEFRADTGIFSRMPGDTSDTNIFKPRETMRNASEPGSLDNRFKRRLML